MSEPLQVIVIVIASYLVGGIPMGWLVARAKGVDIRKHGSGNIGATNVARVVGPKFGALVLLLDVVKGASTSYGAGWYLIAYSPSFAETDGAGGDMLRLAVAVACVVGNTASVFLGFRGGKGVATALGVLLGIYPFLTWPVTISALLWLVIVRTTKYVSLGSIVAAATVPLSFLICAYYFKWDLAVHWPLLCLTIALAALVALRHRSNIGRLRAGTESRIGQSVAATTATDDA